MVERVTRNDEVGCSIQPVGILLQVFFLKYFITQQRLESNVLLRTNLPIYTNFRATCSLRIAQTRRRETLQDAL